jgi:hypothetical protein
MGTATAQIGSWCTSIEELKPCKKSAAYSAVHSAWSTGSTAVARGGTWFQAAGRQSA